MKQATILLTLSVLLLLVGSAVAMSSTSYRLDWYTPLTSSGGGTANSTNYAVNLTVGQAAIGGSSSANYAAGLGYWNGVEWYGIGQLRVFLPLVFKN